MTDIIKRLRERAEHIGRRAAILRGFADQQAEAGYRATADADADGDEQFAADLLEAAHSLEQGSWRPIPISDEVVRYVSRYGGRCRDCADNHGICPGSGLPCGFEEGDREKAIRHVITALNYGLGNGFLALSPDPAFLGEIEEGSGT